MCSLCSLLTLMSLESISRASIEFWDTHRALQQEAAMQGRSGYPHVSDENRKF
jgi:prenyltransferase beta subunit